jgi:hypothetical protein
MNATTGGTLAAVAVALLGCSTPPAPFVGERTFTFDDVVPQTLPPGFRANATRRVGPLATWEVADSAGAPSGGRALSLSYPNHRSYDSFNLCWTPDVQFLDGSLRARVCARSGNEDQGGGVMWRAHGPDDHYVARLNPLERNLRLYHVVRGNRTMLASADAPAVAGRWSRSPSCTSAATSSARSTANCCSRSTTRRCPPPAASASGPRRTRRPTSTIPS